MTLARRDALEVAVREKIAAENLPLYERFVDLADF